MKRHRLAIFMTTINLLVVCWSAYNGHRAHQDRLILLRRLDETDKLSSQALKKSREAKAACEHLKGVLPEHDL